MKQDRSNWTVKKVTFEQAEQFDDKYYASLSQVERLEMLMDIRSMIETTEYRIKPVVSRHHIHQHEQV